MQSFEEFKKFLEEIKEGSDLFNRMDSFSRHNGLEDKHERIDYWLKLRNNKSWTFLLYDVNKESREGDCVVVRGKGNETKDIDFYRTSHNSNSQVDYSYGEILEQLYDLGFKDFSINEYSRFSENFLYMDKGDERNRTKNPERLNLERWEPYQDLIQNEIYSRKANKEHISEANKK